MPITHQKETIMSLELYFGPGACSFVPHVLLEVSGAAFEPKLVKLHKGEHQTDEYKKMNPRGQVPVLVADGTVITQIVAICGYIADAFPAAQFMPTDALKKARMQQTFAWMNNTVHPTFTHVFMPRKFSADESAQASIKAHNLELFKAQLAEIDAMVAQAKADGGRFIGAAWGHDHLSALDAYVLTLTRWGSVAKIDPTQFAHSWAHMQALAAMAPVARVIERERLQLNMMASA
jgi:glutathione S-transferase